MRTTIDSAGRVVIPKQLRDSLGLTAGSAIDVVEDDGRAVIRGVDPTVRPVERSGRMVLSVDGDVPPLTVEQVRDLTERGRR